MTTQGQVSRFHPFIHLFQISHPPQCSSPRLAYSGQTPFTAPSLLNFPSVLHLYLHTRHANSSNFTYVSTHSCLGKEKYFTFLSIQFLHPLKSFSLGKRFISRLIFHHTSSSLSFPTTPSEMKSFILSEIL